MTERNGIDTRRPSKRSIVDGTWSCLTLGMLVGNIIGLALFSTVFVLEVIAT